MEQQRLSISKRPESTSVIIYPNRSRTGQSWLLFWLLAWLAGGLIILWYSFTNSLPREQKIFILIWLAFWLYFLRVGGYAFLWRAKGFERILFKGGKMYYRKELFRFGKSRVFHTEVITNVRIAPPPQSAFARTVATSYWFTGGETIAFDHYNKTVIIGQQLNDHDRRKLITLIREHIN